KEGTWLVVTLKFKNNDKHAIGRPRLSVTTAAEQVEMLADGMPQSIVSLLARPQDRLTPEQRVQLLNWNRNIDPERRKVNQASEAHLAKAPRPPTVKALISSEGLPPIRLHTQGDDFFKETYFLRRGDPANKEGVATQGFLQILERSPDAEKHWQTAP